MVTSHRFRIMMAMLGAVLLSAGLAGSHPRVLAQSAQQGITLQDLGSLAVTGSDWTFVTDVPVGSGAWESVTISNYGYCFVGPNDPRAGTAHAAAVFWFGELKAAPPDASGYSFTGTLKSERGGNVTGHVQVATTQSSSPTTHVEATLSGSDLSNYQDNNLEVCLLGSS